VAENTCRPVAGASNGRWKGGRSRHKAGYVMLWVPDHPRAGRNQYVFEHIIVMEQTLGRYLLPNESVHHRNGVRDDNRPENLELWTVLSPQESACPTRWRKCIQLNHKLRGFRGARPPGPAQEAAKPAPGGAGEQHDRGGGGNRTRVLRYITRASPGAACSAFLSPSGLAGQPPTGSVAVWCPAQPRDRAVRWILLTDARHRAGGTPGLTTS
jgi:HNH endonuclease